MRNWMKLIEAMTEWPETISGEDLSALAYEWHHTPEDFDDGDIDHNITAFGQYRLARVPLSDLKLDMFTISDHLVDDFVSQTTQAPPIIVDPSHNIIIDGNHRANAAAKRGEHDILAYVGIPETYAPGADEEDDDEWHPGREW